MMFDREKLESIARAQAAWEATTLKNTLDKCRNAAGHS